MVRAEPTASSPQSATAATMGAPTSDTAQGPLRFDLDDLAEAAVALVAARYSPPRAKGRGLEGHAQALRALSLSFTSARDELPPGYLDRPPIRAAYLLYYLVTGAATAQAVLRLSGMTPSSLPVGRPLRVLDLGAGPLSASLGVAALMGDRPMEVVAVDHSSRAMADGVRLLQTLRPDVPVTTLRLDLRARSTVLKLEQGFDLVLAANVLNELRPESRRAGGVDPVHHMVAALLKRCLAPGGSLLHWEPGTRAAAGRLAMLRDHLFAHQLATILGPCAGVAVCPLGHPANDGWCHAEQPWQRPPSLVALDEAIGHRRASLKFSWLALASPAVAAPTRPGWRIIGGPMRDRGILRRYLCGADGQVVATAFESDLACAHPLRAAWRGEWLHELGPTTEMQGRRGEKVLKVLGRPRGGRQ